MIPFPLLGGKASSVTPPIPEGVSLYTGYGYRGVEGDRWAWNRIKEEWLPTADSPDDPGHPLHYMLGGAKVGTDGSFRYYEGTYDKIWKDVPNGGLNGPVPLTLTDDGVNIGTSIFVDYPILQDFGRGIVGMGDQRLVGTSIAGSPDLMDLYLIGQRSDFLRSSQNPSWTNAALVMKNVKRGRVWNTKTNVLVENSDGEIWAWGMNFYNQYGPWRDSSTTSSSQPFLKINYFAKIPDFPVSADKIKDIFPGVTMVIVADTDGKFWSKGINIGQFDDNDSQVRSSWVEIPAGRFAGFTKFFRSMNGTGGANSLDMTNCVWYMTENEGLKHFGNTYAIADGSLPTPGLTPLPESKAHTSPVGLPDRTDEPKILSFYTTSPVGQYQSMAIWYDDPEEMYVFSPTSGMVWNDVDGAMYGRRFNRSSAPVGKHRNPKIDFNKEATLIKGFDDKYYASGTSTPENGLTSRTSPSTFVDQKIPASLVYQIELADSVGGRTQVLRKDQKSFMVADTAGGSNFFGNGTLWKPTVTVTWPNYPNIRPEMFKNDGVALVGTSGPGNFWSWMVSNYNSVTEGAGNQYSSPSGDATLVVGQKHVTLLKDDNNIMVGGYNIEGIFGSFNQWTTPASSGKWVGTVRESFTGTATSSYGTTLAWDGLDHRIFGKNYWNVTGGQPVIQFSSSNPVKWNSQPGFPDLPNFRKWVPAIMGYSDDEGTLPQPFFMYRGSDGMFYAAGSNTTGALATGTAPASRDEQRWTFELMKGSEVFVNKNVKVYHGHGNTSCLLFACEGKVYGVGTPNSMKWNDAGTIPDPFFPGFNKRLNEITYLMDLPDVIYTRPIEE